MDHLAVNAPFFDGSDDICVVLRDILAMAEICSSQVVVETFHAQHTYHGYIADTILPRSFIDSYAV